MKYIFRMKSRQTLAESGETGVIVGRAEFTDADNQYLFRYKGGDGRLTQCWWGQSAFQAPKAKAKKK